MFGVRKLSLLACLIYMSFHGTGGNTMFQHSSEDAIDESSLDAGWVLNGKGRRPCQKKGQLKHMPSGKCLMPGGYLPGKTDEIGMIPCSSDSSSWTLSGRFPEDFWRFTDMKSECVPKEVGLILIQGAKSLNRLLNNSSNRLNRHLTLTKGFIQLKDGQVLGRKGRSIQLERMKEGRLDQMWFLKKATIYSYLIQSELSRHMCLVLDLSGNLHLGFCRDRPSALWTLTAHQDAVPDGKEVIDALITSFQLGTVNSDEKPWNLLKNYKADFTRSIHYNPALHIALGRGFPQHLVARIIELAAGISRLKIEIQFEGGYPVVDDMLRRKEADGAIELIPLDKNLTLSVGDIEKIDEETNETKLHVQAILGNVDFMRILILHGANIEARDKQQRTPLISAVRRGQLNAAELLLENKADVSTRDIRGKSPLHYAAEKSSDLLGLLIGYSADVNAVDNAKNTSLHSALMEGSCGLACVKKLLLRKARVNAKNEKGENPLHLAAKYHPNSIDLLLNHSADLETRDEKNRTPLFSAALQGNIESFKLLLDRGADPKVKDVGGKTIENLLGPGGKGEGAKLEINVRSEIMALIKAKDVRRLRRKIRSMEPKIIRD